MRKLIKRYQNGGTTGTNQNRGASSSSSSSSVTANVNNSGAASLKPLQTSGLGDITNFSGWSSGQKIVNDSKALLDKFTSNFNPLPTSGGDSIIGKIGGLKGLGQKALGAVGGLGGAFSLGENLMGSILGKPDINSGAFNTVNNVLGLAKNIPGIGGIAASGLSFVLNGINALGAKKLDKVSNDQATVDALKRSDGGYGNFMEDWNEASSLSGKTVGAFTGADKYNRKIWEANHQMAGLQHITGQQATNEMLIAQMNDRWNERAMNSMNGGFGNISFGRRGLKLDKANIIKIHRIVNEYQAGGKAKKKRRTMEELVKYANSTNVPFIQRLLKKDRRSIQVPGQKDKSTHLLGWGESDGKIFVYPEVMEDENGNLKWYGDEAFDRALDTKDYLEMTSEEAQDFTKNYKEYYKEFFDVPEFKEGGKMNVIPEGSLHARLHHMENAEGLTKKGIPVVSIKEGGEVEQQAEIELNEIIFNLEVTTELEKLMEDGSENAAIEAGKLLVKEIFENTDDRTGLIKQLTEPKEETSEDLVKQHRVV